MRTWYIEKRVEVDAVAAGSHRETKRGIDHTRIWALWMILCSHHLLIPDLNQRLSHIWQGTSCTAQPTADGMLLLSVQKAKRRNRPTIETMELYRKKYIFESPEVCQIFWHPMSP